MKVFKWLKFIFYWLCQIFNNHDKPENPNGNFISTKSENYK